MNNKLFLSMLVLLSPLHAAAMDTDQSLAIDVRYLGGADGYGLAYKRQLSDKYTANFEFSSVDYERTDPILDGTMYNASSTNNVKLYVDYPVYQLEEYSLSFDLSAGLSFYQYEKHYNRETSNGLSNLTLNSDITEVEYRIAVNKDYDNFSYGGFYGSDVYGNYGGAKFEYSFDRWIVSAEFISYSSDTSREDLLTADGKSQFSIGYAF